jgi:hypothetical protein
VPENQPGLGFSKIVQDLKTWFISSGTAKLLHFHSPFFSAKKFRQVAIAKLKQLLIKA